MRAPHWHHDLEPSSSSGTLANFDIEGRTFDIGISRYCSFNLRYRRSENDLRYRVRYYNSISKVLTFDIECLKSEKLRYRMSKPSISKQHDIEGSSISNHETSISMQYDIEETSISKFTFVDIDKCTFDIWIRYRSFVLRYRCLCPSISVFLCWVLPGLL